MVAFEEVALKERVVILVAVAVVVGNPNAAMRSVRVRWPLDSGKIDLNSFKSPSGGHVRILLIRILQTAEFRGAVRVSLHSLLRHLRIKLEG